MIDLNYHFSIILYLTYQSIFFFTFSHSVQESDGSYFESFTALSWKRENRRMSAIRAAESRAETVPENEKEPPGQQHDDDNFDNPDQREQLYLDVLHTISNTVGAPAPGGQVCTENKIIIFIDVNFILFSFYL